MRHTYAFSCVTTGARNGDLTSNELVTNRCMQRKEGQKQLALLCIHAPSEGVCNHDMSEALAVLRIAIPHTPSSAGYCRQCRGGVSCLGAVGVDLRSSALELSVSVRTRRRRCCYSPYPPTRKNVSRVGGDVLGERSDNPPIAVGILIPPSSPPSF